MTRQSASDLRKLNGHLVHLALEVEAKAHDARRNRSLKEIIGSTGQPKDASTWTRAFEWFKSPCFHWISWEPTPFLSAGLSRSPEAQQNPVGFSDSRWFHVWGSNALYCLTINWKMLQEDFCSHQCCFACCLFFQKSQTILVTFSPVLRWFVGWITSWICLLNDRPQYQEFCLFTMLLPGWVHRQ